MTYKYWLPIFILLGMQIESRAQQIVNRVKDYRVSELVNYFTGTNMDNIVARSNSSGLSKELSDSLLSSTIYNQIFDDSNFTIIDSSSPEFPKYLNVNARIDFFYNDQLIESIYWSKRGFILKSNKTYHYNSKVHSILCKNKLIISDCKNSKVSKRRKQYHVK